MKMRNSTGKPLALIIVFGCAGLLLSMTVVAQIRIAVYANSTPKDSLDETLGILAAQLSKVSPVQFERFSEDKFSGKGFLISANPANWPAYNKALRGMGPEGVVVKSVGECVVIVGNSAMTVRHGVFIYLENLGFRYYFPHPDWYIFPSKLNLYAAINYAGQPSFDHRRIWYGYSRAGSTSSDENYQFWFMANKLGGSMNAVIGHAYDDIVSRNKETFLQHPDWLYPKLTDNKIPGNPKFDLGNEALVQFLIADVLQRLEKAKAANKPLKMVTMAPSDGTGTCNTPACQQMGTITDRVYSLINRVAKTVGQKYPGTWVSGMSYSEYAAPPTKKLEPNTYVSVATAFNNSKFSTDQLIAEWSKKAGKVGIYDYLGLYVWDFDLPGRGQGSTISKTAESIKKYYRLGAKGYDAESTPGSINKGLGHYIFSKLLWDVNSNVSSLEAEFFNNCFGKAAPSMKALWTEWESYPYSIVRESDLARWIDVINDAGKMESAPDVKKRLTHLYLYCHYLYLYNKFKSSGTEADRINLLVYSYNTLDFAAFSGYPALWVIGQGSGLAGFNYNDPKAKYKKVDNSFSRNDDIIQQVTADRKLLKKKVDLKTMPFARNFQHRTRPGLFDQQQYIGAKGNTFFIGPHYYVFEIKDKSRQNYVDISGGLVTGGGTGKPIIMDVTPYSGSVESNGQPLIEYNYLKVKDTDRVDLSKLSAGYYLLKVEDPRNYFRLMFSPSVFYSLIATPENPFWGYSRYMCFYVPAGTKTFRVFKEIEAVLVSPSGRKVDMSKKGNEEIDVDVLQGEEGVWLMTFSNGKIHIEGIPPFMSMDAQQFLIPK